MIVNKDEILQAADILSVVQEIAPDVQLKKSGVNWVGKCPLPGHSEKTGSFTVSTGKNLFKCFGCGKGGDAAKFIQLMTKDVFPVALEKVAKISKVKVEYDKEMSQEEREKYIERKKSENATKESLRALFKHVVDYLLANESTLPEKEENGIRYVNFAGRWYKKSTLEKFSLCVPFEGNYIADHAKKAKWDIKKLIQIGILNNTESGQIYDVWKSRFLFPIRDADGYFIAIGGRATAEKLTEKWSKYMNSSGFDPTSYNADLQNILFNKSATFYGFYEGKKSIFAKESVTIVEGYTDVLSLHEKGYDTAVATCGTALTSYHIKTLLRYGIKEVNLFFDGDEAGMKAAERGIKTCIEGGITPYVTFCDLFSKKDFLEWYEKAVTIGCKVALYERIGEDREFIDLWDIADKPQSLLDIWEKITDLSTVKKYVLTSAIDDEKIDYELKVHDPDSIARELSKSEFKSFMEVKKEDGLIWLAMKGYKKNDPQSVSEAINTAAELLSHVAEISRSGFLKALTQADRMGSVQRSIEGRIKELDALKGQKQQKYWELTPEQISDATAYGIFIRGNQYWMYDPENFSTWGNSITNFIFQPRYLIRDPNQPARIVTIKNLHGQTHDVNMATEIFGTEGKMVDEVAKYGNFIFEPFAKGPYFKMIRKLVYDRMREAVAYKLLALGHHHNGFYTWCNGLFDYECGEFLEADDLGLVEHNKVKYLLPGRGFADDPNFEKTEASNEYIGKFRYYQGEAISFEEWGRKFINVYMENGVIALMWFSACLFRDIIWAKHKGFPHLNFSGKKGSGKSRIMWSLMAMFGEAHQDGALGQSTYKSFFQTFMQKVNGIVWFEEFHAKLDFGTWIKSLMAIFDNTGRNKADIASHISTKKTTVKSALAYTGQDEPTGLGDDNALWSRSLVREPKKSTYKDAYKLLDELQTIEDSGQLTTITCQILKHRKKVEKQYPRIMQEEMEALKLQLDLMAGYAKKAEDRTLNNVVILLAMYRILEKEMQFPFTYEELFYIVIDQIKYQTQGIMTMDKEGIWWNKIEVLTNRRTIRHNIHIAVEETQSITYEVKKGETQTKDFEEPKKVLYIRMKDCYPLYREAMVKEQNNDLTNEGILCKDLQKSDPFLGKCRGKKFGKHTYRCWMFDADKLEEEVGVEFKLTLEMLESMETEGKTVEEEG
jgi:DNA primase catalytic core